MYATKIRLHENLTSKIFCPQSTVINIISLMALLITTPDCGGDMMCQSSQDKNSFSNVIKLFFNPRSADSKDECFKQPATPKPATPELADEQQQECEVKKPTSSGNHSDGAGAPIKRRIKKEVPDDPLVMLTPLLSDSDVTTPGSGFINSQNIKVCG